MFLSDLGELQHILVLAIKGHLDALQCLCGVVIGEFFTKDISKDSETLAHDFPHAIFTVMSKLSVFVVASVGQAGVVTV